MSLDGRSDGGWACRQAGEIVQRRAGEEERNREVRCTREERRQRLAAALNAVVCC
jgi:hypothetical protein